MPMGVVYGAPVLRGKKSEKWVPVAPNQVLAASNHLQISTPPLNSTSKQ